MSKKTMKDTITLLGISFSFKDVSPMLPLCFCDECPLATDCLSHAIGQQVPHDKTFGRAVYPTAYKNNDRCPHYKKVRAIRAAYGFAPLFREVKLKDAALLRSAMYDYLGSRSYYYRYNSGEYLLTPEQQEWILNLFRRHGYTQGLEFEGYVEKIDLS